MKNLMLSVTVFLSLAVVSQQAFGMNQKTFEQKFRKASNLTLKDRNKSAINYYKWLLQTSLTESQRSRTLMGLARTYFQAAQLEQSIETYKKISDGSKYWLQAKEEMAWAYTRLDQHEKAQALLRTLLSPVLDKNVGPEVYYLNSFSALKICDFKRIFDTSTRFKDIYKKKVAVLLNAIDHPSEHVRALYLVQTKSGVRDRKDDTYVYTPYSFRQSNLWKGILKNPYSPSSSVIKKASVNIKSWAKQEYKETKRIINLLKLAEVEAIQGMHLVENNKRQDKNKFEKVDGNEYLHFPTTENEFWLDEIDNYEVSVKNCPKFIGGRYANK